jgi:MFS family permease
LIQTLGIPASSSTEPNETQPQSAAKAAVPTDGPVAGEDEAEEPLPQGSNWFTRPVLRLFPALGVPYFRIVWEGNLATSLSYWMQQTVELWLIYEMTGSPVWLSLISIARMGPLLVFSPIGGVLADRLDRTKVVILAQSVAASIALAIAILLLGGWLQPWHLLLAALLSGAAMSINIPARQALIASLVGRHLIMSAVALHSLALNTSRIVGPQIAGVLLALIGPWACYLGQSVAQFIASQNMRRIRVRPVLEPTGKTGFMENLVDGMRYAFGHAELRGVFITGIILTSLMLPYMQFMPVFAKDVYGSGPAGLAILMGSAGVGGLAGSLLTAAMGNIRRKGYLLFFGSFLMASSLIALSLSPSLALSSVILIIGGVGNGIAMLSVTGLMQFLADDRYRGRIGSLQIVLWGVTPFGAVPMGIMAERVGVPLVVGVAGGIAAVLLMLTLLAQPKIRRIQ